MLQLISFIFIFFSLSMLQANDFNLQKEEFYEAIKKADLEKIKKLHESGFNIHTNFGRQNALHQASYLGHSQLIEWLLDRGFDINGVLKDKDFSSYESPLIFNTMSSSGFESLKILVDRGADVNAKDRWIMSPLHWAALNNDAKKVAYLIENGAKVNALSDNLESPLHMAARTNSLKAFDQLIKLKADPDIKNLNGETAFSIVLNNPFTEIDEKQKFKRYMRDQLNTRRLRQALKYAKKTSELSRVSPNIIKSYR